MNLNDANLVTTLVNDRRKALRASASRRGRRPRTATAESPAARAR